MLKKVKHDHLTDYLFGYLSLEDQRQVEAALAQDKELAAEFNKIQDSLAGFGGAFAKEPSEGLKGKIMAEIMADTDNKPPAEVEAKPAVTRSISGWKWYSVAASVAFLVSIGMSFYLKGELDKSQDMLAYLQSERSDLQNSLVNLTKQTEETNQKVLTTQQHLAAARNFETVTVTMNGSEKKPDALAEIYWNPTTKDIFLHKCNLPKAPEGFQHQLWAIVDGAPVDMGVFDIKDNQVAIQHMGTVETASAFAVTIETQGGNPTPNLEELVVIGEV